jgi:hypothetical protein
MGAPPKSRGDADEGPACYLCGDYWLRQVLISDDYYPALQRPNVTLVSSGVDKVCAAAGEAWGAYVSANPALPKVVVSVP